jgi:hypothetical protein
MKSVAPEPVGRESEAHPAIAIIRTKVIFRCPFHDYHFVYLMVVEKAVSPEVKIKMQCKVIGANNDGLDAEWPA